MPQSIAEKDIDTIGRFLNNVDTNIIALSPDFNVHVFIFEKRADLEKYWLKYRGHSGHRTVAGFYDSQRNAVFTYARSGPGTICHELMHKVLEDIPFLDSWAVEGIPALFEKFYGYPEGDGLHLLLGAQNPWRIKALGTTLEEQRLVDDLSILYSDQDESRARLIAVFLYRENKLQRYLELSKSGQIGDYPTMFEATMKAHATELEPKWHEYLKAIGDNRDFVMSAPANEIFPTRQAFENADALHNLSALSGVSIITDQSAAKAGN